MRIGLPTPAFARQIVELNAAFRCAPVRATAHDDDTSLGRVNDAVHQPVSEDEMAEMIDDELRERRCTGGSQGHHGAVFEKPAPGRH